MSKSAKSKLPIAWLIGLGLVVVVSVLLLVTPLGTRLWMGLLNLPGITWAREQMIAAESSGGEQEYADVDTEAIDPLLKAGRASQEKGAYNDALRRYREALRLSDKYAPTHVALASLYLQMDREDEALTELEKASELAPDNGFILTQLGRLYLRKQRYDESVAALKRAKQLTPDEPEVYYWLGAALYFRSYVDTEAAVTELEKAVQLAPDETEGFFRLGLAYMHRDNTGDGQRAVRALEQSLVLDADQVEAHYYLGQLYVREGQREAAIAAFRQYLAKGQDTDSLAQVRGWLRTLESGASPTPGTNR